MAPETHINGSEVKHLMSCFPPIKVASQQWGRYEVFYFGNTRVVARFSKQRNEVRLAKKGAHERGRGGKGGCACERIGPDSLEVQTLTFLATFCLAPFTPYLSMVYV